MTDDERDELAAAYLDGACTPTERARVEADPDLLARVEVQRQVQEALSGARPEAIDPARREVSLTAALAAFDELQPAQPATAPSRSEPAPAVRAAERPVSLAAERRRREERRQRIVAVLGVAAAFVAVVGIASQGGFGGGGDDDDSAEVADGELAEGGATETTAAADALAIEAAPAGEAGGDEAADLDSAEADAATAGAAEADTTTTAAAGDDGSTASTIQAADDGFGTVAALPDLGAFTDAEALAAALPSQARLTAELADRPLSALSVEPECQTDLAAQGLTVVATAEVAGQPALLAADDPVSPTAFELVDATTCTITGTVDLPR